MLKIIIFDMTCKYLGLRITYEFLSKTSRCQTRMYHNYSTPLMVPGL